MPLVEITGWRYGFRKISCTHLLQQQGNLSLSAAKAYTDRILSGEQVTIPVEHLTAATQLAEQLRALGADTRVMDREFDV